MGRNQTTRGVTRRVRWGGSLVCVVVATVYALTGFFWIECSVTRRCRMYLSDGSITVFCWVKLNTPLPLLEEPPPAIRMYHRRDTDGWDWWWHFEWGGSGGFGTLAGVRMPLWLPLLIAGIPTARAWRSEFRRRRRARAHLCGKCGYDLAGLRASTLCPECGHAHTLLPS